MLGFVTSDRGKFGSHVRQEVRLRRTNYRRKERSQMPRAENDAPRRCKYVALVVFC